MKTLLRFTLLSVLLASVSLADIGQKGREKHHDMNEAVIEHREKKIAAKAEAEASGKAIVQTCPDLVIKKGKRVTVIQCGNPKRNNPACLVCGVKA